MTEQRKDWDPKQHERIWYRRARDGQLGWLVVRDGKDKIKLDRSAEDLCVAFMANDWIPEVEHRPMTRGQAAQVAWKAEQALQQLMGNYSAKREWNMLHEDVRIEYVANGPKGPPLHIELYRAVMGVLEKVTR
jgi:hypothetical protein